MLYRIVERSIREPGGALFLIVDFWPSQSEFQRGAPPTVREDFTLDAQREGRRIVRDNQRRRQTNEFGFKDSDEVEALQEAGETVTFVYENYVVDVREFVEKVLSGYWENAVKNNWSGDHTFDTTKTFYKDGQLVKQRSKDPPVRSGRDPRQLLPITPEFDVGKIRELG